MVDKLLKPAILLMNRLAYKEKISILFLVILLPFVIFTSFALVDIIKERTSLEKKVAGLQYNEVFANLIEYLQKHRSMSNAYINGDSTFKNDILKVEEHIELDLETIYSFDKERLELFQGSQQFKNLMGKWKTLKFDQINTNNNVNYSYTEHTKLIKAILDELLNLAKITKFTITNDSNLYYAESLLYDKLPSLIEYIEQTKGLSVGILARSFVNSEDREQNILLYGKIKSGMEAIRRHDLLTGQKNYTKIATSITNFLKLNDDYIINTKKLPFDSKTFFSKSTKTLIDISNLHGELALTYKNVLLEKISITQVKIFQYIAIFALGLILLLCLFVAFYQSIMGGLKKLQQASLKITNGETHVRVVNETKDELADVVDAFNKMGYEIKTNMLFLNGYKTAIDESSIVSKTDTKGVITYANSKFQELSGYSIEELIGKPHNMIRHPDMPRAAFKQMWETLKAKKIWKGIVKNKTKNGKHYIVDATIVPILDCNGNISEYIAVRHDITELENKKDELTKQRTDLLTGLANRNQMLTDLIDIQNPVLMLININSFGKLNDFYGSKIGDKVLIKLGNILNKVAKDSNVKVYRLHADEFAFLSEQGTFSHNDYISFVSKTINYIELNKILYAKNQISITTTAGIAFGNMLTDKNELSTLLANANSALRSAKKSNKKYLTFDKSMQKKNDYENNMQCVNIIKDAILNNQIVPYFQPIINNKTGNISKYESLVRLIKPDGSVVSPFFFLDIAKKAKLYSHITKIVIDKTFNVFRNLDYEVSINISSEDIQNVDTIDFIKKSLKNFPDPKRVIFEIVESEEITNYDHVSTFIKEIKQFGAKIAIDDFGSGYSNFEHILALDIDYLKIDGSLVKNIDNDENSKVITNAIIAFSKRLNRQTVVEFIHNEEVYNIAKKLGADFSQGFYLGEPEPKPKLPEEIFAQI